MNTSIKIRIAETQMKSIKLSKREQKLLALLYNYFKSKECDTSMYDCPDTTFTLSNNDFNRLVGTRSIQERIRLYYSLSRKLSFSEQLPDRSVSFIIISGIECDPERTRIFVIEDFLPIMKKCFSSVVDGSYLKIAN